MDEVGHEVMNSVHAPGTGNVKLDVNPDGLPMGVYLLQIRTSQGLSQHKLIKK